MLLSIRKSLLLAILTLAAFPFAGTVFAQPVVGGPASPLPYAQHPEIFPLDCGDTKQLVKNTTSQPRVVYLEVRDCCDRVDSVLYVNNINNPVYFVPDGGVICASVVLQPGDKLFLDCNGHDDGKCHVDFKTTCNDCP